MQLFTVIMRVSNQSLLFPRWLRSLHWDILLVADELRSWLVFFLLSQVINGTSLNNHRPRLGLRLVCSVGFALIVCYLLLLLLLLDVLSRKTQRCAFCQLLESIESVVLASEQR